jgi:hypothetical protein
VRLENGHDAELQRSLVEVFPSQRVEDPYLVATAPRFEDSKEVLELITMTYYD